MIDDVYHEGVHDPASHVRKTKAIQQLGATAVVSMSVSGADPLGPSAPAGGMCC